MSSTSYQLPAERLLVDDVAHVPIYLLLLTTADLASLNEAMISYVPSEVYLVREDTRRRSPGINFHRHQLPVVTALNTPLDIERVVFKGDQLVRRCQEVYSLLLLFLLFVPYGYTIPWILSGSTSVLSLLAVKRCRPADIKVTAAGLQLSVCFLKSY